MRMRFSMKTFLVAVGLAATCCGAARMYVLDVCAKADRHDLAIKRLKGLGLGHDALGAFVDSSKKLPTNVQLARKWIHPHAYPEAYCIKFCEQGGCIRYGDWKWDDLREHLGELKHLMGLRSLRGDVDSISLDEAKHFGSLRDLEDIHLTVTGKIEPGALSEFARCPKLKKLWLFAQIDRELIEAIRDNSSLKNVQINGARMTPELMQILGDSPSIEKLRISKLEADEEMLSPLKKLRNLEYLCINDSQFTAMGINELIELPVTKLLLGSESELPVHVSVFATMKNLEYLAISATAPRTPGDISSFAKSSRLRRLHLDKLAVDAETLHALGDNMQLRLASFTGEAEKDVAMQFAEGGAGRWLFLHKNGSDDPWKSFPKMYEGKNCGDLEAVFPSNKDE